MLYTRYRPWASQIYRAQSAVVHGSFCSGLNAESLNVAVPDGCADMCSDDASLFILLRHPLLWAVHRCVPSCYCVALNAEFLNGSLLAGSVEMCCVDLRRFIRLPRPICAQSAIGRFRVIALSLMRSF